MTADTELVLYHIPRSRSITALWMLEELGRPYRVHQLDYKSNEQRGAAYLRINPSGKVPAVADGGTVITERGAICLHLADRYAPGRLAPAIDDPRRADYVRWMFYAIGVMEPLMTLALLKIELEAPPGALAWGEWDTMMGILADAMAPGPFLLGGQFTAADVLVGSTLAWGMAVGILPREGPMADYVGRISARPSWARTAEADGIR